ncbi:hypothetical protein MYMA111404_04535 [Mycoplasma marinum]|uniref:Lipoprotein n=1 Tax=Mycoplasma marinum TaxID=1937190 RepID=A0A4R0XIS2_9MOLU|nr:hypothetical protein [Mycoplasma marinum]TCG10483.1 hypothetical protein C4B24_04570 [Mycoplasma marinum]
MNKLSKKISLGVISLTAIAIPSLILATSCGETKTVPKKQNTPDDPSVPDKQTPIDTQEPVTQPWQTLTPALKIPKTFDESKSKRLFRELHDDTKTYDEKKQLLKDYTNSNNNESWYEGEWSSKDKEKQFFKGGKLPKSLFLHEPKITELHIGSNITDIEEDFKDISDSYYMHRLRKLTFARNGNFKRFDTTVFQFLKSNELDLTPLYKLEYITPMDPLMVVKVNILKLPKSFDVGKYPLHLTNWPAFLLDDKKVFTLYAYNSRPWDLSQVIPRFGLDENVDIYTVRKYFKIYNTDGVKQTIYE